MRFGVESKPPCLPLRGIQPSASGWESVLCERHSSDSYYERKGARFGLGQGSEFGLFYFRLAKIVSYVFKPLLILYRADTFAMFS